MKRFAISDDATGEVVTIGACADDDLALQTPPAGHTLRERPANVQCGWVWNDAAGVFDPPTE